MRVALMADTHNQLPDRLVEQLAAADAIWHLGDVCDPRILAPLEALGVPPLIVRGNNDANPEWPLYLRETVGEHRCFLIHIAPRRMPADTEVLLHGHTHVPRDEVVDGVRVLNPGCIGRPNRGAPRSFAWLTLKEDGSLDWRLELL